MDLKDILKQLEKEKDILKYLKSVLEKTTDKKLQEQIKDLIKKYEEKKEPKPSIPSLESAVSNVTLSSPSTETFVPYSPRRAERTPLPLTPSRPEENNTSEGYGSSVKEDYLTSDSDVKQRLETSGLITRSGFNTTAEAKEAMRQKGSRPGKDYTMADRDDEVLDYHNERDQFTDENPTAIHDLRESHKKKKNTDYL